MEGLKTQITPVSLNPRYTAREFYVLQLPSSATFGASRSTCSARSRRAYATRCIDRNGTNRIRQK
jgi:hypothetical protein